MFAVVYNKFSQSQLLKLQKLYIHRHKAAEWAFDLLTTKANPGFVTYNHFEGMMRYYRPKMSELNGAGAEISNLIVYFQLEPYNPYPT